MTKPKVRNYKTQAENKAFLDGQVYGLEIGAKQEQKRILKEGETLINDAVCEEAMLFWEELKKEISK